MRGFSGSIQVKDILINDFRCISRHPSLEQRPLHSPCAELGPQPAAPSRTLKLSLWTMAPLMTGGCCQGVWGSKDQANPAGETGSLCGKEPGVSESAADLIVFLDADDEWMSKHLETLAKFQPRELSKISPLG
jgi:hypothetical protein